MKKVKTKPTKPTKKKKVGNAKRKPTTNMVQKVNVKVNNMTGQPAAPAQRSYPPSIVQVPYPVQAPNTTQIIPHQFHKNPFDSVAFQEKIDNKISNLTDLISKTRQNDKEFLAPKPSQEYIAPEPFRETLLDNETEGGVAETEGAEYKEDELNVVTPTIRIPNQSREKEKWILDTETNTLRSTLTNNVEKFENYRHMGGNNYVNDQGVKYNTHSKRKSTI